MSVFQMELNDYPHFFLTEDGRLCSTGQHCPWFLRVLYDALLRLDPSLAASRHRHQYDGTHHPHLPVRGLQYLFNLQHHTAKAGMQQRMHLTAYEDHATATSRELERLRHENAVLCSSALPLSELDRELQVAYHHLRVAKHGLKLHASAARHHS
jgi:hypothetical protein